MIINVFGTVTIMAVFCKNFLKIQFLINIKTVFRNLVEDFLQLLQPAEILPRSLHMQGYPHFPVNEIKGIRWERQVYQVTCNSEGKEELPDFVSLTPLNANLFSIYFKVLEFTIERWKKSQICTNQVSS